MSGSSYFLYGDSTLIRHLKHGELPVISNWQFLHPFLNHSGRIAAEQAVVTEQDVEAEQQRQYQLLPDAIRALLSFADFCKQKGEIRKQVVAGAKLNKSRQGSQGYNLRSLEKLVMMRLYSSPVCHYGWLHQAASYQGLCIGLDASHSFFSSEKGRPVQVKAVEYGGYHRFKPEPDNPFPGLFFDHGDMEKMAEWRFICPRQHTVSQEGQRVKISPSLVQSIGWSTETPDAHKEHVENLVRQDMRYRHVELLEIMPDAAIWALSGRQKKGT